MFSVQRIDQYHSEDNNKLNSSFTIKKPTTIHLGKLNDCKKTFFSLHSLDITNLTMHYKTLRKP